MVSADAAALHAMSYPAVVVRHDMIDGIRALQLTFGAAPMAICHLCAGTLFAGDLDTVDCVSENNMIHLKCAMLSFADAPSLFNVACPCSETEEERDGSRPVCGGFSVALVDKAARAARAREQEEALAHEVKMNALVDARTVMDPARFEGLPSVEEHRGGGEKKRCEVGRDVNEPLEGGFTGGCGGMRSERLGTEEEKSCVVGELPRPHVAHEISSDLMLSTTHAVPSAAKAYIGRHRAQFVGVSGNGGSEDLLTTVKTNLPTPRAIGKRIVILALTLLHFCGGAQSLNWPIRGPLRRDRPPDSSPCAGRGLVAALGCVPPVQAAVPPLRVVENKHNYTSLPPVGEMLQQRAWTPQRAPLKISTGQDSSALLRALGGAIMYTWMRKLYASVTLATPHCYRQADVTTEANRPARLRTCLPGRCRLHLISRHHIRQLGILVRRASNRSGEGEEAMPISLGPRASVSSASKPTTAGPRQGDTSGWESNRDLRMTKSRGKSTWAGQNPRHRPQKSL